jgi:hypothetical protein
VTRSDNCLIQEPGKPVWLLQGGARFPVSSDELLSLGYDFADVRAVPAGFTDLIPLIPEDGTLLRESDGAAVSVVFAGGRFGIPTPEAFDSIGLDWSAIRVVPPDGLAQIPERPKDYNRFREVGESAQFSIIKGKKLHLDGAMIQMLKDAGAGIQRYTLWEGALGVFPDVTLVHGDASCDGEVTAVDALHLLQTTAGIPNVGICVGLVGNVDCDDDADAIDALMVLRYVAGIGVQPPAPTPSPEPTPTGAATPTPGPSDPPAPTPTVMPTPVPSPTGQPVTAADSDPTPTPTLTGACPPIGFPDRPPVGSP